MNRLLRRIHYWGTLLIALPLLVVISTGVLLQIKKQWVWVQPAEQKGAAKLSEIKIDASNPQAGMPVMDFATLLQRLQECQSVEIKSWDDVQRIDIRPSKGIAKFSVRGGWEVQLDLSDGRILQEAIRRSDWIESMHDGSFFGGDWAKLGVFLPAALVLLVMWGTGLWLFLLPFLVKRRRAIRKNNTVAILVLSTAWYACSDECFSSEGISSEENIATASRPNIVFILADDLGVYELGCYGQTKINTPNIDRLAREGMRFTQHYSGAPVCAPSRCVLMTGKHLGHAQIRGNKQAKVSFPEFNEGQHPITDDALTIAEVLQRNGYATGAFGKWGLGPVGSSGDPNKQGFDRFFGYNCQSIAHSYYPEYLWDNNLKVRINPEPIPGHKKQPLGDVNAEEWIGQQYAPEVMIEQAQAFIADHRNDPFFLYLPFIEPHVAMHPPLKALENFPLEWDERPYRGGNGYLPHPRPRAAYAAMIEELDRHVGKVLDALDRFGLNENTLVVFTSDNGPTHPGAQDPDFHIGGADPNFFSSTLDLRGYKGSVYEGGIRVPMIARWSNHIPAGSEHDAPSYFADWFPTLCEIAQVQELRDDDSEIFDALDGESLLPVLEGQVRYGGFQRNSPMVWVFPEYTGQVAVRWGDFKLVRRGLATSSPMEWELYDLANDPGEGVNLADAYPQVVEEGKSILTSQSEPNSVFPVRFDGTRDEGK